MERTLSLRDAYGSLTRSQNALVARVRSGEDVRFNSPGVRPMTALSLMDRRVLDCQATTCRFVLLPPTRTGDVR